MRRCATVLNRTLELARKRVELVREFLPKAKVLGLFWDAASFGLVEKRSTHVVIGEFSSKFAKVTAAAPWLDAPTVIESPPGT